MARLQRGYNLVLELTHGRAGCPSGKLQGLTWDIDMTRLSEILDESVITIAKQAFRLIDSKSVGMNGLAWTTRECATSDVSQHGNLEGSESKKHGLKHQKRGRAWRRMATAIASGVEAIQRMDGVKGKKRRKRRSGRWVFVGIIERGECGDAGPLKVEGGIGGFGKVTAARSLVEVWRYELAV
ncbi:hypothetical protein CPB83DRAFT_883688 [Crepidotus variabilis]|uniref:Uncharacterized protein n=1 Tax=Crepidotus variabilis TaxID=179855 RepID=A0A9P6EFJ8_9AGAR|nr:hypothetical protein CPB83DRAFT_883688 [Crepidotus variabilis]